MDFYLSAVRTSRRSSVKVYIFRLLKRNCRRVAVSKHLRQQILYENHGRVMAGHFSGARLYEIVSRKWWWEDLYKDAISFCKNCPECAVVSGTGKRQKPPLHPIQVGRPFQILGVDIMELPVSRKGNRYVVVFQDFLTKWPFVFATPDQKAVRIVELLTEKIVPSFGCPEALLPDRGTNLLANVVQDVLTVFRRFRIQGTMLTSGIASKYVFPLTALKSKSINRKPTSAWRLFFLLTLPRVVCLSTLHG